MNRTPQRNKKARGAGHPASLIRGLLAWWRKASAFLAQLRNRQWSPLPGLTERTNGWFDKGRKSAAPSVTLLSPFHVNHRYGLRTAAKQVLPPRYDAVWPLLSGRFWGFRQGEVFGVLAVDGAVVSPCTLPAVYRGFTQLSATEEQAALRVSEPYYLGHMRRHFPGLQVFDLDLCKPGSWLAEEVTPHLEESDCVFLETGERTLLLWSHGRWSWLEPPIIPVFRDVIHATLAPLVFSALPPHAFYDAGIESLLQWRLRRSATAPAAGAPDVLSWPDAEIDGAMTNARELDELLTACAISAPGWAEGEDAPMYWPYLPAVWPATVLPACEQHLEAFITFNDSTKACVQRLIYLAWLWANGYVYDVDSFPFILIDQRYPVDPTWFGNAPIEQVYQRYELRKLETLLVEVPWLTD